KSWCRGLLLADAFDQNTQNRYPLPRIDDLCDQLQGSRVYSKIDLRSGYHQLRVREEYIPKTAFMTRYRYYEFQVKPFGLTNASAIFMDMMNRVFKPYLDKFVIIFIDDILIYYKNKKEHEGHLKLILSLLKEEILFTKCKYWLSKVKFLDHVIDSESIHIDPSKIESVKEWASPKTPIKIQGSENFLVYCDASHKWLGAVLMQREKVIAYVSRQLKHILDKKELNMRQHRWLELLSDYDCEIRFHPGKADVVEDSLIQKEKIKPLRVRALGMTIGLNIPKKILNAQAEARKERNYVTDDLHVGMPCAFYSQQSSPKLDAPSAIKFPEQNHFQERISSTTLLSWRISNVVYLPNQVFCHL
nr:putative reverse transcriptase domain-containing protein [Tanacetum cinerariifolium]